MSETNKVQPTQRLRKLFVALKEVLGDAFLVYESRYFRHEEIPLGEGVMLHPQKSSMPFIGIDGREVAKKPYMLYDGTDKKHLTLSSKFETADELFSAMQPPSNDNDDDDLGEEESNDDNNDDNGNEESVFPAIDELPTGEMSRKRMFDLLATKYGAKPKKKELTARKYMNDDGDKWCVLLEFGDDVVLFISPDGMYVSELTPNQALALTKQYLGLTKQS